MSGLKIEACYMLRNRTHQPFYAGIVLLALACVPTCFAAQGNGTWRFAISGDSRNCGDIAMPAIAAGAKRDGAEFYWHLGDYRAMYNFDEDYLQLHPKTTISDYQSNAWPDFIQHQLKPFGDMPVFLAIGNHEMVPPGNRASYIGQFADWINRPVIQNQRALDKQTFAQPFAATYNQHEVKTYYHWIEHGIDFITLDNASPDQFDANQMAWVQAVLQHDASDPKIRTIVVGMHATFPDSLSAGHSMNDSAQQQASGGKIYSALVALKKSTGKNVYILGSHSHFVMNNLYETACRAKEDVLPGWLVGTAGAVRYRLPADTGAATVAKTDVYGYLLATVAPDGTITFEYKQVNEADVPADTVNEFTPAKVQWCFNENKSPSGVAGPNCAPARAGR